MMRYGLRRAANGGLLCPDMSSAIIFVLGNCSNIILMNTVRGIAMINPAMPHIYPQSMSITRTVMIFTEKVFPINTGSKTAPNSA